MEQPAAAPTPFAEHERVYLLAEIIKAGLPSHVLINIIRETGCQPKWHEIALPHGRNLRSCQAAYNEMNSTIPQADYRRPQLPAPIVYPGPDMTKKRAHQPEAPAPMGRHIQPRPPHSYPGDFVSGPPFSMSPVGEPANKKKRGRPTKAEAQARADAAAARGEVYPPPRKSRPSITAQEQQQQQPPLAEARQPGETPPGTSSMQPAAAMTPQHSQPPERGSESSSGKKKRSKPTPLELPTGTESPLAFGSATGDTSRGHPFSTFTPISAPLPSESRDRDIRMEGVEESQPRTTTPRSFKDTVGI